MTPFAYLEVSNEFYGWVKVQKCICRIFSIFKVSDVDVFRFSGPKRFIRGYILYISW